MFIFAEKGSVERDITIVRSIEHLSALPLLHVVGGKPLSEKMWIPPVRDFGSVPGCGGGLVLDGQPEMDES
jgi:hypothetical protein